MEHKFKVRGILKIDNKTTKKDIENFFKLKKDEISDREQADFFALNFCGSESHSDDETKEVKPKKTQDMKAYRKEYYKNHKEKFNKPNTEENKEYHKKYYKENPEKYIVEDKEELSIKGKERYRKRKEREYIAKHGSLEGFKGVRNSEKKELSIKQNSE